MNTTREVHVVVRLCNDSTNLNDFDALGYRSTGGGAVRRPQILTPRKKDGDDTARRVGLLSCPTDPLARFTEIRIRWVPLCTVASTFMASTNRTPYRAEHTPDHTDFPPDRDTAFSSIHVSPSRSLSRHPLAGELSPHGNDDGHYPPPQYQSHLQETAWRKWTRGAREVAVSNTGFLLIAAAQFFFAMMNVWVKKLNTLAAVPALEVCVDIRAATLVLRPATLN